MRIDEIASNAKYRKRRSIPKLDNFFKNLRNFANLIISKFDH